MSKISTSFLPERNEQRRVRWFFGGLASAVAVGITHPLDLVKVHLQTQVQKKQLSDIISNIYKNEGILGFYSGISAALFRQLTYSTTRFAIYESGKSYINSEDLFQKFFLAISAGIIGGVVGIPSDVVNVRMQNDIKLPPEKRRNYKNVFHGFSTIIREENVKTLFSGWQLAITRSVILTIGTNLTYDQVKKALMRTTLFEDKLPLHFLSSTISAVFATFITQPIDVTKTVVMNSKKDQFKSILDAFVFVGKGGPLSFFKGFLPALFRIAPNTVMTFLMYEQLRLYFGVLPKAVN